MVRHITNFKCNLCGKEMSTGWCRFKITRYIKKKIMKYKHIKENHTKEEILLAYTMFDLENNGKWIKRG